MGNAAHTPITSKVRLGSPVNADLFTTTRDVAPEKPKVELGVTMAAELGPAWAEHYVVGVTENPNAAKKQLSITHFKNATIADQNTRNFEVNEGDVLVRTYVILRTKYEASKAPGFVYNGADAYQLPPVAVGDDDALYGSRYGFTHEAVVPSSFGLDGVFVMVQRYYQQMVKVEEVFDDELEMYIRKTVEIVPHVANRTPETPVPGKTVEYQTANTFYDLKMTEEAHLPSGGIELPGGGIAFPIELTPSTGSAHVDFPPLLRGINWLYVWAFADSKDAAPAYDEAFTPEWDIVLPARGPFNTTIRRFLTDKPEEIRAMFKERRIIMADEGIPIARSYYIASDKGNTASANTDILNVPASIHGAIQISSPITRSIGVMKEKLDATPGFGDFAAGGSWLVGVIPSRTRYNLWVVTVEEADIRGLYNGRFGNNNPTSNTGAADVVIRDAPMVNSVAPSPGNISLVGNATAGAAVIALIDRTPYGQCMADAVTGDFVLPLTQIFYDPVQLTVVATKSGIESAPVEISTLDLVPLAPSATALTASGVTTVSGVSEAGATITVDAGVAQVETATVAGTISTAGTALIIVSSNLHDNIAITPSVLIGDTASVVAEKARLYAIAIPALMALYDVAVIGAAFRLTKKLKQVNDPNLNISVANGSCAGLTAAPTSANTTAGREVGVVTADNSGAYSFVYNPALANGTSISVTAADAGGTSPATVVSASTTPPTLGTAGFPTDTYDQIVGTGVTVGAKVVAYLDGVAIGDDIADGSGGFEINLLTGPDPRYLVAGEKVRVTAELVSDPLVKSPSIEITAYDLNLEAPKLTSTSEGFIGQAPADVIEVVVVFEPTGAETVFPLFANRRFLLTLDLGYKNGQRYIVYYRYPFGLSDPAYIYNKVVPLQGANFEMRIPVLAEGPGIGTSWIENQPPIPFYVLNGGTLPIPPAGEYIICTPELQQIAGGVHNGLYKGVPRKMLKMTIPDAAEIETIELSFPGSALPDVTYDIADGPFPAFEWGENPGGILNPATFPYMQGSTNGRSVYVRNPAKALPSLAAVKAVIPALMIVKMTAFDGRVLVTTFDRAKAYPFNDPAFPK